MAYLIVPLPAVVVPSKVLIPFQPLQSSGPGTAAEAEFVILNETEVQLTEAGP